MPVRGPAMLPWPRAALAAKPSPAPSPPAMNCLFFRSTALPLFLSAVSKRLVRGGQWFGIRQIELHGQADLFLQTVARIHRAIAQQSNDAMGMHHGIAVLAPGDAAVEGGHFHFLIEPHHLEGLLR